MLEFLTFAMSGGTTLMKDEHLNQVTRFPGRFAYIPKISNHELDRHPFFCLKTCQN